jgi:chemotaxis protein MotB
MTGVLLRGNNRDRWLLSYADFITVLFAAFVLMYAAARARERAGPSVHDVAPNAPRPESNLLSELRNSLKAEQQKGAVTLSIDQRGIVIALDDKLCFLPGKADVQAAAVEMFTKVAGMLSRHNNRILLEGHTDSVPIHNAQFRSNWELSTARSIAVMELMEGSAGIPGQRFLIGGSADNAPVSSNQTEQGRAHNRRVEIIVLDAGSGPIANYRTN